MKKIALTVMACSLFINTLLAQRYLADTFTAVDSVVNIAYGSAPNYQHKTQTLHLDFYEPKGDKASKRPLIIYVHGGGFTEGTRKWASVKLMCEKLAMKGYAVASIDYRLDPTANVFVTDTNRRPITDAMHDLKAAIRFFKANQSKYRIDTANIVTGGESAGAVTAMTAAYVDKISEL
ncbi:MAG: alpha/beta hydrolase, partial [Sphingobacteriaceae bacterium]